MSITSEEDVEEDAAPLSDADDRSPPSQHGSSDSNHHDSDLNGRLKNSSNNNNPDHDNGQDEDRDNLSSNSISGSDYDSDEISGEEGEDNDDDENNHFPPNPQPFSQHTFAPPFYGRPPTPLPPSPSLTSLLRPSRPTTPDASDDEQHNPGDPLPRARPKVPTYEYYGFVLYLFSSLSFLMYLLWSYLPSPFLHALGIDYYPNRWWSLAVPSFIVMLLVYIYVALAAYNVEILTLPMKSIETVVDQAAQVAVVDGKGRIKAGKKRGDQRRREQQQQQAGRSSYYGNHHNNNNAGWSSRENRDRERERERELVLPGGGLNWKEVWNEGTDAVMDVPLAGVCEILYGEWRDTDRGREGGGGEWEEVGDEDITKI